ncbi:hypothetical protein HMPREF1410_01215 [Helicobacter pylori GAM249T]|nr:hypothetical protein HMPREF1393_01232 [Helicobacter pylori GAM103Bi]EMH08370.1 hypothetical protein HMPREF1410_01215 [Helicobacter pylori GAM249T]
MKKCQKTFFKLNIKELASSKVSYKALLEGIKRKISPYAFMILLSNKATFLEKLRGRLKVLSVKFLLRMA